jgi:hypothetical protein
VLSIVIVFIVVLVAVAVCLVVLAVRGGLSLGTGDPKQEMLPIDVAALLNLVDESQQEYLRSRLSKHDFAKLQRQRNRALLVYVKRIASNAATLMRFAHAATQVADPEIAVAGRQLLQSALSTRMQALRAMALLYAGIAVPSAVRQLGTTIARYSSAEALFATVGRLSARHAKGA